MMMLSKAGHLVVIVEVGVLIELRDDLNDRSVSLVHFLLDRQYSFHLQDAGVFFSPHEVLFDVDQLRKDEHMHLGLLFVTEIELLDLDLIVAVDELYDLVLAVRYGYQILLSFVRLVAPHSLLLNQVLLATLIP